MEAFSGERRYAKYKTFSMAGEVDNYRLSVDGYSGDAGTQAVKTYVLLTRSPLNKLSSAIFLVCFNF